MLKLSDFTKKQGVKKLTPKQKVAVSGGGGYTSNITNSPPKQNTRKWGTKG